MSNARDGGIERKVQLGLLQGFYGGLLTEGQQQVLSLYCGEDMTMAEIAQELGISRQAVHEQLHRAEEKMNAFEERLGTAARFQRLEQGLTQLKELLGQHSWSEAEQAIETLLNEYS